MSSRGNLLSPEYTTQVVAKGKAHDGVFGFIGNGSRPDELTLLRTAVGDGKLIWTPGVNLAVGDGEMGQRYGDPREAVLAGSDCIIVGSGIHKASDPAAQAKAYAAASWQALCDR
jgi:orotidine-5'-phosphate decarboxylase